MASSGACAFTRELSKHRTNRDQNAWVLIPCVLIPCVQNCSARSYGTQNPCVQNGGARTLAFRTAAPEPLRLERWRHAALCLKIDTAGGCHGPNDARADIFHDPPGVGIVLDMMAVRAPGT